MRFRNHSYITYPTLLCSALVSALILSGGCSGGSSSISTPATPTPGPTATPTPAPTPTPGPVTVQASIAWGTRSRVTTPTTTGAVPGLSSALSATISLPGAKAGGGDLTFTANRPVGFLGGIQNYSSPTQGQPGTYLLTVTFYSDYDAKGQAVGVAQANATILASGQISYTISTVGKIQSVVVNGVSTNGQAASNQLKVGTTGDLVYSLFDGTNGSGNLLAQSVIGTATGSGVAALVNSADTSKATIVQGDRVTGLAPALVPVTVTVDGVTSAAFTLSLRSDAVFSVVNPGTTVTVSRGLPVAISVGITGDPTNAGVTFSGPQAVAGNPDNTAGVGTFTTTNLFSGTYTAPITTNPALPYSYTVVATSNYDPSLTQTITFVVVSQVTVSVTDPQSGITNAPQATPDNVAIRQKVKFVATVGNVPTGSNTVTWSLLKADGTPVTDAATFGSIASDGTYTAPGTAFNTPIKVRATSTFDPNKFQDFYFIVQSGNLGVIVQ